MDSSRLSTSAFAAWGWLQAPQRGGDVLADWESPAGRELARRGRARTVCAFSPVGSWTAGAADQLASVMRIEE